MGSPATSISGRPACTRSLLDEIRAATGQRHAQLEDQLDLLGAGCTVQRYRAFLRATCSVVRPLDAALSSQLGEAYAAPGPRSRVDRLHSDLAALGDTTMPGDAVGLPDVFAAGVAYGGGYVLQGSLLGGAVIARAIRTRLGLGDGATSYLRTYGDGLGAAWQRFVRDLEDFGAEAPADVRAAAVAAAMLTFDAFGAAMAGHGLTGNSAVHG